MSEATEKEKATKIRRKSARESVLQATFAATRYSTSSTLWDRNQQGGGLLQRQCACGVHTIGGGECDSCRQKRESSFLQGPAGHSLSSVQLMVPAGGRPKRQPRLTLIELDSAKRSLSDDWKKIKTAGGQSDDVDISTGKHSCGAKITLTGGRGSITGSFCSETTHAEMNALEELARKGFKLSDIEVLEIEKEPCTRCAVILHKLRIAEKVAYKNSGQKDYPTWRFPNLPEMNWAELLGITAVARHENDQQELLNYFFTHKWW